MTSPQAHQTGPIDPNLPHRPQHPLANYQFSPDELRVLRECNTDSFFQRSLPFGTGFGVAAYFCVKHGYLRPNAKYGAIPKVVLGVVTGYFLGKFSYQQKCAEKIMRLPNSKLGEVLRNKQKGSFYGGFNPEQKLGGGLGLSPFSSNTVDIYSDDYSKPGKSNSLELDMESRPMISGLDDTFRPSVDDPSPLFENDVPVLAPKQGVTYEELRAKNREEYAKRSQMLYSRRPVEAPTVRSSLQAQENANVKDQTPNIQNNKYGDSWTN